MTDIQKRLCALRDEKYAAFQAKLAPTIPPESCVGVRLPALRKLAAELAKEEGCADFLETLPHETYDENLLHAILLERGKDYALTLERVERFLPFVDNWAVCDTLRPKVFAKHRAELLPHIRKWIASTHTYTCRFAMDMLMTHYLDADFSGEYPAMVAAVRSGEYYVRMMAAWYFATALAKQWDAVIPYLTERRMDEWTHRKTIRKAIESYRITDGQKEYLRTLL